MGEVRGVREVREMGLEMGLEGDGDGDGGDGGDVFKGWEGWQVGRSSEVSFVQEL